VQFLGGEKVNKKKTAGGKGVLHASGTDVDLVGDGDDDAEDRWVLEQLKKGVSGYKVADDGKGNSAQAAAKAAMEKHAQATAAAMVRAFWVWVLLDWVLVWVWAC
jgi:hypothetical protein